MRNRLFHNLAVSFVLLVFAMIYTAPNGFAEDEREGRHIATHVPTAMTADQADAILSELKQIRQLLENQAKYQMQTWQQQTTQPPQETVMGIEGNWHSIGREDAPVTIVEFTDYECPYCARFHVDAFPRLKEDYIDTGKVRFVTRNLPLAMHEHAMKAAEAALCAGDQGKFWEMRDTLIAHSSELDRDAILKYGTTFQLNISKFTACLDGDRHDNEIQKDVADATALQISGTPTFIIGPSTKDTLKGHVIVGAQPYSTFEAEIQQALK